ncbi:MAG: DUF4349 domain-containing protein [Caulobacteraceae bacterium]
MRKSTALYAGPLMCGLLFLAACSKPAEDNSNSTAGPPPGTPDTVPSAERTTAAEDAGSIAEAPGPSSARGPSDAAPPVFLPDRPNLDSPDRDRVATPAPPVLAYSFRVGLVLPADDVRPMYDSHQEACERAGPYQCQVLSAGFDSEDTDKAHGHLTLRATPAWMSQFRNRVEEDVRDAGGRVEISGADTEEVDSTITQARETQASLSEQIRDLKRRLANERRSDRSLALQAQIRELEQQRAGVRAVGDDAETRAAMATFEVDYQSSAMAPARGVNAPIANAMKDFWGNMAHIIGFLINVASFTTPFVLIGIPLVWLARRGRKPEAPKAQPPQA